MPLDSIAFGPDSQTFYVTEEDIFPQPYYLRIWGSGTSIGNVTVTNSSLTVMGVDTGWDASLEGYKFGLIEDNRAYDPNKAVYTIDTIVSPTELTLTEVYDGISASDKSYKINSQMYYGHGGAATGYYDLPEFTSEHLGEPWAAWSYLSRVEIAGPKYNQTYILGQMTKNWGGFILAANIMEESASAKTLWNHNALFDWADKYWQEPDVNLPSGGESFNPIWVEDMWDTYRADYGDVWVEPVEENIFYVSPTGSGGDGSVGNPFSLSEAQTYANENHDIEILFLLEGGEYGEFIWDDAPNRTAWVAWDGNGQETNFQKISIDNYPDNRDSYLKFKGLNIIDANPTAWRGSIFIRNANHVYFGDLDIRGAEDIDIF